MVHTTRRTVLKSAGIAALGAGLLGTATGCRGDDGTLDATWWGNNTRHKAMQAAIDLFVAQRDDIEVSAQPGDWAGYWDKLAAQVAAGSGLDWLMMDTGYIVEYAGRGALAPLDSFVGKELNLDDVPDSLIDGGRLDGTLYVAPLAVNTQHLLYNRTMLDGLGITLPESFDWSELAEVITEISDAAGEGIVGADNNGGSYPGFEVWLRAQGGEIYTGPGELGFGEDEVADWFGYWAALQEQEVVLSPDAQAVAVASSADQPVVTGVSAMTIQWTPQWEGYQALTEDTLDGHLMPTGPSRPGQYLKAANLFATPTTSDQQGLAAELANFLINDPAAVAELGMTLGVPASTAAQETILPDLSDTSKAVIEYHRLVEDNLTPQAMPWIQGHGAVHAAFTRHYENVSFGERTVAEGAAEFVAEATEAVKLG